MPTGRVAPRLFALSALLLGCEDPSASGDTQPTGAGPALDAAPASGDRAPDAGPLPDGSPRDAEVLPEAPELPPLAGAGLPACHQPPVVPAYPSFPPPGPFVPRACPAWGEAPGDAEFLQADVTLDLGSPATDGLAFRAGGRTIVVWWAEGEDGFFGIMDAAGSAFAATGVLVGLDSSWTTRVGERVAPTCDGFVALTNTTLPAEAWSLTRIDLDGREAATRPLVDPDEFGYRGSASSLATADEGIILLEDDLGRSGAGFPDARILSILDPATLETSRRAMGVPILNADLLAVGRLDGETQLLLEGSVDYQTDLLVWSLPLGWFPRPVPGKPNAPDPLADAATFGNDGLYLASMGPGEVVFTHAGSDGLLARRTVRIETDKRFMAPRQVVATETGAVVVVGDPDGHRRILDLDDAGHRRSPDRLADLPGGGSVSAFLTPDGPAAAAFQGDRVRVAPVSAIFSTMDTESPCSRQAPGECGLGSWALSDGEVPGGENGGWRCVTPEAAPEVCNGRDDDCDGGADEALADCPIAYAGPRVGPPPPVTCALLSDFLWPWQLWHDSPVPDPCAQTAADAPCAIGDRLGWQAILRDDSGRVLQQNGVSYRWDLVDGSFQGTTHEPDSIYEYDEAGRLASIRNSRGEALETFEYEPHGRLTRWWQGDRRGDGRTVNYLWSDDGEELIAWPMPFGTSEGFVGRFRLSGGLIVQGESEDPMRPFSSISFGLQARARHDCETTLSYGANDDEFGGAPTVTGHHLTIETDHAGRQLRAYGTSYFRTGGGHNCDTGCRGLMDTRYRYDERGRLAESWSHDTNAWLAYDCAEGLPE